jgi:hypothetical protein
MHAFVSGISNSPITNSNIGDFCYALSKHKGDFMRSLVRYVFIFDNAAAKLTADILTEFHQRLGYHFFETEFLPYFKQNAEN